MCLWNARRYRPAHRRQKFSDEGLQPREALPTVRQNPSNAKCTAFEHGVGPDPYGSDASPAELLVPRPFATHILRWMCSLAPPWLMLVLIAQGVAGGRKVVAYGDPISANHFAREFSS